MRALRFPTALAAMVLAAAAPVRGQTGGQGAITASATILKPASVAAAVRRSALVGTTVTRDDLVLAVAAPGNWQVQVSRSGGQPMPAPPAARREHRGGLRSTAASPVFTPSALPAGTRYSGGRLVAGGTDHVQLDLGAIPLSGLGPQDTVTVLLVAN